MTDPAGPGAQPPQTSGTRVRKTTGSKPVGAARAKTGSVQAPPPEDKSKLKKRLMLSILILIPLLSILIAIKFLWPSKPVLPPVDPGEAGEKAFINAKTANAEIFALESKVWVKGENLKAEDYKAIAEQQKVIIKSNQTMMDMVALLEKTKGGRESKEWVDILKWWMRIKVWVLDVDDLLTKTDKAKEPPVYGGLYVPMYSWIGKSDAAQKELKELELGKGPILEKGDAAAKEEMRQKIRKVEETLGTAAEKLSELSEYIKTGLARPEMEARLLQELETLGDEQQKATMSRKQARELRSQFRE